MAITVEAMFEELCYDEKGHNLCRAIEKEKIYIEITTPDMDVVRSVTELLKEKGFTRVFFGFSEPSEHIKMSFERG